MAFDYKIPDSFTKSEIFYSGLELNGHLSPSNVLLKTEAIVEFFNCTENSQDKVFVLKAED
jgi:hypothetical protein